MANLLPTSVRAQVLVPGTGHPVAGVGDDFEDASWEYIFNLPKSTEDINKNQNAPSGQSKNGRWYEGMKRGQPDVIRRVPTPEGGLAGSKGSLLLQTLQSGVAGHPSYHMQQDDFIADVNYKLGSAISVSRSPSVVTRVFFPPLDKWERRNGASFAFRVATEAYTNKRSGGLFSRGSSRSLETYWLGFFVDFRPKSDAKDSKDTIEMRIRADESGQDFPAVKVTKTGWWTLGMSFSPDGQVHYFAHPGVADLTAKDLVISKTPYGLRCETFKTMFFNVCSGDDGRTWSTPWIIDDPTVYVAK
ncbi:MAG: hypothetical protein K8T25_09045 [Planctomycetia bacterium]|nr:hypothetical protein [Planctomycetia bacterium]